jgi:uncharacterized protein (DUF433 family)
LRISIKFLIYLGKLAYNKVEGIKIMEIRHYKFNRITVDPDKCFGKSCIRGLRIPVSSILSYLSSGMTIEEILKEWPELEREDIYQALGYAALSMEERFVPLEEITA